MKRALRFVILGPFMVFGIAAMTVLYPLVLLLAWLLDDPYPPGIYRDVVAMAWDVVWGA